MKQPAFKLQGLSQMLFDAMPAMVFIVDEELRIQEYNYAAAQHIQADRSAVLQRRTGNVLRCVHGKETPGGCGCSLRCQHCLVRKSVNKAFQGLTVRRFRARIRIWARVSESELCAYISAFPIRLADRDLALLVLQFTTELPKANQMIPMCSVCRQVRNQDGQWQQVESYFRQNWNVSFSHGLCPNCYQEELAKVAEGTEAGVRFLPRQDLTEGDKEPALPADQEQPQPLKSPARFWRLCCRCALLRICEFGSRLPWPSGQ
jgi:hypothetical protein